MGAVTGDSATPSTRKRSDIWLLISVVTVNPRAVSHARRAWTISSQEPAPDAGHCAHCGAISGKTLLVGQATVSETRAT